MVRLVMLGALIAGLYYLFTRMQGEKAEKKEPGDDAR
jgi:hypothetical protein